MKKPTLFIWEGAQGVGKTTLANLTRELISYTVVIRLTGVNDGTVAGAKKVYTMHKGAFNYIKECVDTDLNFSLDRSFLTEFCYCKVGYKPYDFKDEYFKLLEQLVDLSNFYNIKLVLLTAPAYALAERLEREKSEYLDLKFNVTNSINQQNAYIKIMEDISRHANSLIKYKLALPPLQVYAIDTTIYTPNQIIKHITL